MSNKGEYGNNKPDWRGRSEKYCDADGCYNRNINPKSNKHHNSTMKKLFIKKKRRKKLSKLFEMFFFDISDSL